MSNQKGLSPIIIILIITVIAVGAFYFGRTYNKPTIEQITTSTETSLEKNDNRTLEATTDSVPKPNTIYLGTYQNKEVLFVTNREHGKYYEEGVEKFSEYKGSWMLSSDIHQAPTDYKDLQNSKRLLSLIHDVMQIQNFKLSDDKKFVYLSLILKTKTQNQYPENATNHIYRVNLDTLTDEELWVHEMSLEKYKNVAGATTINKISPDNNYLVLSIYGCYACGSSEAGLIILNNQTKKDKYFEKIGNVQFNLDEKTFTYQKLAPFKEPCDFGQGCDNDNTRTVYKPDGEIFTEALP